MIINVNEDILFKKRDLTTIFPHEFSNRWLIKQFITYVLNHFFEKSYEKNVSSYIGEYIKNIDGDTCYINEPTQERQLNQLIPFVKFGDTITNYENFVSDLHNEGCLVDNVNKLLSGKHWSWCPPINIDMFINYNYYYWIGYNELEKNAKILTKEIDVERDIIGKKSYLYYDKNTYGDVITDSKYEFKNGDVVVFLKDKQKNYSKVPYVINGVNNKIKLLPLSTPLYYIDGETNVIDNIIGKKSYHYSDLDGYGKSFDFINGMRLIFLNDANSEYNNKVFIVDGVGTKISLIEDKCYELTLPNYHTIERGSLDNNRWSASNRWVHKSVIEELNIGCISTSLSAGYVEYSEINEYEKGDFVIYNNNVYMCSVDRTEYGKFDYSDWKFISQINLKHAEYPIICFNKNMELYNHGTKYITDIDYVFEEKSSNINGRTSDEIAQKYGITTDKLSSEMKILCLNNEIDDGFVFSINKLQTNGLEIISLRDENISKTNVGDCVYVNKNSKIKPNKMLHFDGTKWVESQAFDELNQSPLFNLYDGEGELLSNQIIYPKTTFKGSTVFDYKDVNLENEIKYVSQIGRYVSNDDLSEYNFRFDNHIITDTIKYTPYKEYETEIKGYRFIKKIDDGSFINDWHVSEDKDTSYLKTRVIAKEDGDISIKLLYNISDTENREPCVVYVNGELTTDYEYTKKEVSIKSVQKNDVIDVKFLTSDDITELNSEYVFEQPLSITVNQMNEEIETISYNNCFDQMVDIIQHQYGILGNGFGKNNYSSISHNLSVGTKIVQHSESLLKTMYLINNPSTSIRAAIEYAMTSYSVFKLKFENIVNNMYKTGRINDLDFNSDNTEQLDEIIKEVIDKINLGKEGMMPFYNNGVLHLIENAYIPSTPSFLGLTGCYKPRKEVFKDHFKEEKPEVIINHDGSFRNVTNTIKDDIFLRLETLIYDSIDMRLKDKKNGLNRLKLLPGKFRKSLYTRDDVLNLYSQHFNMWSHINELNYSEHYKFDYNLESNEDAWKTWNYTNCKDVDGNDLYGSYRNVYTYYYDTYRPDTHPWEMLGFDDKPSWWDNEYGAYPYTSYNKIMWDDIENGIIRNGPNKGEYSELKRPGLVEKYLPVDKMGKLKNPMDIGIIKNIPFLQNAKKAWEIGDIGEMEFIYLQTSEYRFVREMISYLLRPCEWVETNWDTINRTILFENTNYEQIINNNTKMRENTSDVYFHNELVDGEYQRNIGMQQWISDYILSDNKDISVFGNELRNVSVNLGYRCAGFYQKDGLRVISDSFGELPEENVHLSLFKSNIDKTVTYSGIKIFKTKTGFMIDGFDKSYPYFKIRVPFYNGKKSPIEEDGVTVFYYNSYSNEIKKIPYKTEYKTIQDVYTFINAYEKYLEDNEGWYFTTILPNGEVSNFRISSKSFLIWAKAQIGEESTGNVILLNPAGYGIGNYKDGIVESMGIKVSGRNPVVDIEGQPIKSNEMTLLRNPYNTYIKSDKNIIGCIKLKSVQYEHILLFDNKTLFDDIIYNPKYSTVCSRLKLSGVKIKNWYGSLYAPGYIITDDGVIENYDKKASDLQYIYDVDDVRCSGKLGEYTRDIIGFQISKTFKQLFQNNKSMFDFYKGSIAEKGTKNVINKMNRSSHVSSTGNDVSIYENWLFKAGEFGYTTDKSVIEFLFETDKMNKNSQIITLETCVSNYYDVSKEYTNGDEVVYKSFRYKCVCNDGVITKGEFDVSKWEKLNYVGNYIISWDDEKWIKKPLEKESTLLDLTNNRSINPTGGYVHIDDCQYIIADDSNIDLQANMMKDGEIVWVVKKSDGDWDILRKTGISRLVSLRYPTIDAAYKQNRISNVYHFVDNKIDYYTDKTRDEAEIDSYNTKLYTDIDLKYGEKRYSDIDVPKQNEDAYYLYKNGVKHKIKMNNTIFETLVPESNVNRNSILWFLGVDKEERSFPYSDTLLKMKPFGKDLYDYQYELTVKTDSNVYNPKITINGLVYNNKNATLVVNGGDTVSWSVDSYGCQSRSGILNIPDLNYIENPLTHKEKVSINVPMNYVKNTILVEHTSSKETKIPLTSVGTYNLTLVSAGGGAGGGSWYNGSFKRKKYSTGGGGASGGYTNINFEITKDILDKNREYVICTGKGGYGGSAGKKSGNHGGTGEPTYFGYYENGSNDLVILCKVYGGMGNYGGYNSGPIFVGGRELGQGGFLDLSLLNTDASKEYNINIVEYRNGMSISSGTYNGASIYSMNGVKYGSGGSGVYKSNGNSGTDGYSKLMYISDTIVDNIYEEERTPIGRVFTRSDSKEYVGYYQKFIDENNYFYSYDIMYKDDGILDNVNENLNMINPSSLFYKNRCRSITAKHKSSVNKNLFTNTPGKKYFVGDTVTYNGKYYVCVYSFTSSGIFSETIIIQNENAETYEVTVWEEYTPTYYYKITDNSIYGSNVTTPQPEYKLYEDSDCKTLVSKDNGNMYMTCDDLILPADNKELNNILGSRYYLVDVLNKYSEIESKYINEPTWKIMNHNGYYSVTSGGVEYFVKLDEDNMKLTVEKYNGLLESLKSADEDDQKEIKILLQDCINNMYLYSDNNCQYIAKRKISLLDGGVEIFKEIEMTYIDIINVEMDNYEKCYEYKDNDLLLYSTKMQADIIANPESEMYFDPDLVDYAGTYSDFIPKWSMKNEIVDGVETPTKNYKIVNIIEHLKEGDVIYIDNDCFRNRNIGGVIVSLSNDEEDGGEDNEDEENKTPGIHDPDSGLGGSGNGDGGNIIPVLGYYIEPDNGDGYTNENITLLSDDEITNETYFKIIGSLSNDNKIYSNGNVLIGVLYNNVIYKDKNIKVGNIYDNNLYYIDGKFIGLIKDDKIINNNSEVGYIYDNEVFLNNSLFGCIRGNIVYTTGNEIVGKVLDGDILYLNNSETPYGKIIYNVNRLSDTQNIGSEYGCYSDKNEYGWIKATYLGDDYLTDSSKYKFDTYDIEKRLIDVNSIDSVYIIDDKSDKTLTKVQLYDPIQCIIPNNVLDEVNYISSTDPVIDYNDSGKWSDGSVGVLWWDTSAVRYVDYHIGDLRYKFENWGKQLVGSQIVINEWYRDITPPTDNRKYVTKTIYNENTNSMETYYYYWLKNPTSVPNISFRNNSAYTIARIIANPSDAGIVWVSPIELSNTNVSKLSMIISEYNNSLLDDDCALQININRKNVTKHAEWAMVSENNSSNIPEFLWSKVRESLLGYKVINEEKVSVPDQRLTVRNKIGLSNRPLQTVFNNIYNARRNFIDIVNDIFESRTIDNISTDVSGSLISLKDDYDKRGIEYDYESSTKIEMLSWNDVNLIGSRVLVKNDETHDNIWVLYRIDDINDIENGYVVLDYQKYDIEKYLEYKDWYRDIEVKSIQPTYIINDINMVNEYLNKLEIGKIVKYENDGDWKLYQKSVNPKTNVIETNIVGISKTLLYIKDTIYDYVNKNIDNEKIYIDNKTKFKYIEEESNILLEYIIDYFGKN